MRASPLLSRVRHFGSRAYERARSVTANLDKVVETSADLYGNVIRPLLHHGNYDTSGIDHVLMSGYGEYDQTRSILEKIDRVLQR
jgi:hypothetical protein